MIEPDSYVVHAPDSRLPGGHPQARHGGLILGIAEQVCVAINQSGHDRVFREIDEFHAGRSSCDNARYAILFDDDVCMDNYVAATHVDEAAC